MPLIRPIDETDLEDVLEMIHGLAVHHGDIATVTVDDLRRDTLGPAPWVQILVAPAMGYAALTPLAQMQFAVRGMDVHHLFVREPREGKGSGGRSSMHRWNGLKRRARGILLWGRIRTIPLPKTFISPQGLKLWRRQGHGFG